MHAFFLHFFSMPLFFFFFFASCTTFFRKDRSTTDAANVNSIEREGVGENPYLVRKHSMLYRAKLTFGPQILTVLTRLSALLKNCFWFVKIPASLADFTTHLICVWGPALLITAWEKKPHFLTKDFMDPISITKIAPKPASLNWDSGMLVELCKAAMLNTHTLSL